MLRSSASSNTGAGLDSNWRHSIEIIVEHETHIYLHRYFLTRAFCWTTLSFFYPLLRNFPYRQNRPQRARLLSWNVCNIESHFLNWAGFFCNLLVKTGDGVLKDLFVGEVKLWTALCGNSWNKTIHFYNSTACRILQALLKIECCLALLLWKHQINYVWWM